METTFATVVDEVRQLSTDEKIELVEIIQRDLVDVRRDEILENCAEAKSEYEAGKLVFTSNVDELMASLDD
ncbi:MAG: hypothetical protein KBD94_08000 [Pyrinomonadaceae bacterium]|nr:hypothetical protein [Pyrinomonadaceae bacterium]